MLVVKQHLRNLPKLPPHTLQYLERQIFEDAIIAVEEFYLGSQRRQRYGTRMLRQEEFGRGAVHLENVIGGAK